jgi:Spy/CpxP family protein refolding chaperone
VKSRTSKFIAFAALAVAMAAGLALAEANGGGPGMRHGMRQGFMGGPDMGLGMMLHKLNLTDAQHEQVKQIMQSERPNFKPLMQQEGQLHQQMLQLVTSGGNLDQAKASAIASQEAQVHMQMQLEHMKIASQIYGLLDQNQKSQVSDMIAKHQQRMQEHMQKMENQTPPVQNQ